jgi:hypothetical protein
MSRARIHNPAVLGGINVAPSSLYDVQPTRWSRLTRVKLRSGLSISWCSVCPAVPSKARCQVFLSPPAVRAMCRSLAGLAADCEERTNDAPANVLLPSRRRRSSGWWFGPAAGAAPRRRPGERRQLWPTRGSTDRECAT